jgi:hypothetical protein
MVFCTYCGKEPGKEDVFCTRCGNKLKDVDVQPQDIKLERTLKDLRALVDTVADEIKKQLLGQISEIESGFRTGTFTQEEFDKEAEEIKERLLRFTE